MSKSELRGDVTTGPKAATLAAAFRQVIATGRHDVTALISKPSLTFEELDRRSDHVAQVLLAHIKTKVKRPQACLLVMEPSVERVIGILALLKINLPYVPVEACVDKSRLKLIIREIRPLIVLTCEQLFHKFSTYDVHTEGTNGVLLIEELEKDIADVGEESLPDDDPAAVACILYTSGSTGVPKGVMLTHGNIMARLAWQWRRFPFEGKEVGIAKTSLQFVDSISELWSFLLQGRPVVIIDQKTVRNIEVFVELMTEHRVSRLVLVPSLLEALIKYSKSLKQKSALSELKEIICSGERLSPSLAKAFFNTFDGKCLMNFYGSTEVTGDVTYEVFQNMKAVDESTSDGSLSIGVPIDNVVVRLVDNEGNVVVNGEIGEIIVSGPTVMAGYFKGQPSDIASGWYHTGDYGRVINGKIVYMGRKDDQIKIRGHRVNLEEIEKVITNNLPEKLVVVMVMKPESVAAEIVAFIEGEPQNINRVEEACKESLPLFAIPKMLFLTEIPKATSSGKIDRRKLIEVHQKSVQGSLCENQPADPVTQKLLHIIGKELDIESQRISLDHEFSAIGGNSVNKIFIASTLRDDGVEFNFQDFLMAKTIGDMQKCITNQQIERLSCPQRFRIVLTNENSPHAYIRELTASVFAEKEPLFYGLRMKRSDCCFWADIIYETGSKHNGNFVVLDNNDEIVGAMTMFDPTVFKLPDGLSEGLKLIYELLAHCEKPMYDSVPKGKHGIEFMSVVTDPKSSTEDNFSIIRLCEQNAVDVARERGFATVMATNTNHVTQAIAAELGYENKQTCILCEYQRPNGSRPLAHLPRDARIKSQVKFF